MYQNSKLIHFFAMLVACAIFAMSKPAIAAFGVIESTDNGFYGNAQNRTFKSAVEGIESLDDRDKAFLASVEESRTFKRWYTRVLIGQPRVTMKNIENRTINPVLPPPPPPPPSDFPLYISGIPMGEQEKKDDSFTGLLAWGYHWNKWAWELELLLSERLKYQSPNLPVQPIGNPTFIPDRVQASISKLALFTNIEYTFDRWFDFMPRDLHLFVLAGGGVSANKSDVTTYAGMQARKSESTTNLSPAWQVGIGARFQISPHFLLDFSYRYMDLGKVKFGPVDGTKPYDGLAFEAKKFRSTGAFLGLTYKL